MQNYDFIFIYEHKVRELENICLMKYELDRRGYKTKIMYLYDAENAMIPSPVYHTRVLCTMACYDDHTLYSHAREFIEFEKVIDLQWENIVYTKDEERVDAYKNYRGIGKDVVHLSWGQQNVNRLLNAAHLDPKKVKLTGHVGMDFLRFPLNRYYTSRRELFEKYGLPEDKKVILFASPYYGDGLSEAYIKDMCMRFGDDWPEYYAFMCESQKTVLNWFEKACNDNPDMILVYRLHPGHPSAMASELEKRCDNFRIISGESVKQWIVACDRIYTGNSSVVVEAYFAQKMCQLLFPIPITPGFELKMIEDSKKITTYEEFARSLSATDEEFPTPKEDIEEVYLIDWNKPNYIKFADMAEEVLQDDYYKLSKSRIKSYKKAFSRGGVVDAITRIKPLYAFYRSLVDNESIKWKLIADQRKIRNENIKNLRQFEKDNAHELTNDEEIQSITERIKKAIEG